MTRTLLVLLSLGLLAPVSPREPAPRSGTTRSVTGGADPEVTIFIDRVNDYRESIGCPRLVVDMRAQTVAQAHSEDMYERRYVAHVNPDDDSHTDRLRHAGLSFSIAGENLAQTGEGGEGVLQLWLASPPHRVNIQNCAFLRHGVGRYKSYWTHVLFRG
jgi:uncharacterized protein YkwD